MRSALCCKQSWLSCMTAAMTDKNHVYTRESSASRWTACTTAAAEPWRCYYNDVRPAGALLSPELRNSALLSYGQARAAC